MFIAVPRPPPAKRRKVSTGFDAAPFKTQHVSRYAFHDTHLLEHANDLRGKYNRLIPFIRGRYHDSANTLLASYRIGWAFQQRVEEIHSVIRDTHQRLELGLQSLQSQMKRFSDATLSLDRWYEGGDLFSFELPELIELIGRTDVANDVDYYIGHVHRIIPRAFRQVATEDERNDRRNHTPNAFPTHVPSVLAKAITLLQPIINQGRDREAFHLFVLLKTEIKSNRPRLLDVGQNEAHQTLNKAMGAFVAQIPIDRKSRSHVVCPDGHLNVRLELQNVDWRELDTIGNSLNNYWDFAGAARILRRAYIKKLCVGSSPYYKGHSRYNASKATCFHGRTADLLEWLQTKAWSEIRVRVFRAVGPFLPTEITEDIFEFALVAEEIPLHPRLEEKARVSSSDSVELVSQRPRQAKRLKAEYRCWYVERMRGCSSTGS